MRMCKQLKVRSRWLQLLQHKLHHQIKQRKQLRQKRLQLRLQLAKGKLWLLQLLQRRYLSPPNPKLLQLLLLKRQFQHQRQLFQPNQWQRKAWPKNLKQENQLLISKQAWKQKWRQYWPQVLTNPNQQRLPKSLHQPNQPSLRQSNLHKHNHQLRRRQRRISSHYYKHRK